MAFKIQAFLVRRPGMSFEAFREHYETKHVPLARKTFPEIQAHRRNYLVPGSNSPGRDGEPASWDAITDIWFADKAAFEAMAARIGTPAAAAVSEDEPRFLDLPRCKLIFVEEVE